MGGRMGGRMGSSGYGSRRAMTLAEKSQKCKNEGKVLDRNTKKCRLKRTSIRKRSEKTVKRKALMVKCRKYTGKTRAYPKGSFKVGKRGCVLRAGARMKKTYRKPSR